MRRADAATQISIGPNDHRSTEDSLRRYFDAFGIAARLHR